jgi:tripartite-type tricarboxylate transporter receptor subunit TctC
MAKHLPDHIPGKPSVIVQNMPGASSMIAANYLYNTAKPDGLTIAIKSRGLIFAQLAKAEGARFDFRKYAWIGSPAVTAGIVAVRTDSPYKTFDDLRKAKQPLNFGGSGGGDTSTQVLVFAKEFLGANMKLVVYKSMADILLAVERKELDGTGGGYASLKPSIDRGLLTPLIRGRTAERGIENLPVNEDLTTDKTAKTIMAMYSATEPLGRPFCAPPGTPTNILDILREAFKKATEDPELRAESEKIQMPIEYVSGEECIKLIDFTFNQPPEMIKEFVKYVKF